MSLKYIELLEIVEDSFKNLKNDYYFQLKIPFECYSGTKRTYVMTTAAILHATTIVSHTFQVSRK